MSGSLLAMFLGTSLILGVAQVAEDPDTCSRAAGAANRRQCMSMMQTGRIGVSGEVGHLSDDDESAKVRFDHGTILAELSSLDGIVRSAADEAPITETTRELLRALRVCQQCAGYERYGDSFDGGYVMCSADELRGDSGLLGVYSYGIAGYDGWGMSVAQKFNIPLFEYDCTNDHQPQLCAGCSRQFFSECLQSRTLPDKQSYSTLDFQLRRNGHANIPDGSLLVKFDIETSEWDLFADEPPEAFKKFRQMVVEFHNFGHTHWNEPTFELHGRYLMAIRNILNAGFAVVHLHGNNHGDLVSFGDYRIPNVLEVTFARKNDGEQPCRAPAQYRLPQDAPNDGPATQELPDPRLPAA